MVKKISNKTLCKHVSGDGTVSNPVEARGISTNVKPLDQEAGNKVAERVVEDGDAFQRTVEDSGYGDASPTQDIHNNGTKLVASDGDEPSKKFLSVSGDELVQHHVDHKLYCYVQSDDLLQPGRAFDRATGVICVVARNKCEVAEQLVFSYASLWSLLENPSNPGYYPWGALRANTLRRRHRFEGSELASVITCKGYFDTPTVDPFVKAWNVEIVLPRTVVVQRILVYWLQCMRINHHPCYPTCLQVGLQPAVARRHYARLLPELWPIEIAEQSLRAVLHCWRRHLSDVKDKMLYRALNRKMVKLARSMIRSYARCLTPLCHALDDFMQMRSFTFDRWLIQTLSLQTDGMGKAASDEVIIPKPAWAHRMNVWLR